MGGEVSAGRPSTTRITALSGESGGRVLLVPSLDERAALGVLRGMLHEYIVRPMEKVKTIFIMST